jgi:hypothetical protein
VATATPITVAGPSGARLYGGKFGPAIISAAAVLDGIAASGEIASPASLSGQATVDVIVATGSLAPNGPSDVAGTAVIDVVVSSGGFSGSVGAEPPTTGFTTTSLTSASTQTAPFTFGQPFKQGDLPSGSSLAGLQTNVKSTWPDGSAKIAVVSGIVALTAATARVVGMQIGAAVSGSNLTTAQLKAQLTQPVTVDAGAFGSASWSGTDWDAPFQTWVTGPVMSSWVFRKQIGGDAHLVAWLEVRLWSTGAVEALPWVENGYLTVAGPTSKSATYTFTMGGTQRFSAAIDLLNHQRTPLVSGTAVSHWLGTDPNVTVRHDVAYMQASRLVPYYSASVSPSASVVTGQPSSFTPLQQGSFPNGMGAGGYSPSIGILPEWDVLYLTCTDPKFWKVVQWQGYSAGRYGMHFRDESTNRPVRFSSYPNLCLDITGTHGVTNTGTSGTASYTPAATGAVPPAYTNTHAPAMGYLAYLLTGRVFHLETAQFEACINYLKQNSVQRAGSDGVLQTQVGANTTRGAAWALRTLAQAAAITPDGDTLRTEFLTSLGKNVDHYHGRYIQTANCPYGIVEPYSDYTDGTGDNIYYEATWMQDFFTAAIGMTKSLKLPLTTTQLTRLDEFFAWKAQSVVNRFQGVGSTEFLYRDAAPYTFAIAPTDSPDFTTGAGPWYLNWGQIYDATYLVTGPNGAAGTKVEGALRGAFFPDGTSYWGNLQPALAYAVEHGVAGALTAFSRMRDASNWSQLVDWFNVEPVWGVVPPPALTAVPAWRAGQAVNTWREIPGTAITLAVPTNTARTTSGGNAAGSWNNRIDAWNSLALDTRTNKVYSVANGGHGDYYGNEVVSIDMLANSPLWSEVLAGSSGNVVRETGDLEQYADLTPPSTHSYYGQFILERHDRALRWGGSVAPSGGAIQPIEAYQISANNWDAWNGATQDPPYGYSLLGTSAAGFTELAWSMAKHPHTEDFYVLGLGTFRRFRPARVGTGLTMTSLAALPSQVGSGIEGASAIDTTRNRLMWLKGNGDVYTDPVTFDLTTGASTLHTFQASAAATALRNMPVGSFSIGSALGMVYVPQIDSYIVRANAAGGRLWKIHAGNWTVEYLPTTGGTSLPAGAGGDDSAGQQRVYNRILYVPSLGGVLYFPVGNGNAWFYRLDLTPQPSYFVDFTALTANESPISRGGIWTNASAGTGGNAALAPNNSVQIRLSVDGTTRIACETGSTDGYEDSISGVPGFPGNQRLTATVYRQAGYTPSINHELLLGLGLVSFGTNNKRCIHIGFNYAGGYFIAGFNGSLTSWDPDGIWYSAATGANPIPLDGDQFIAELNRTAKTVKVWHKRGSTLTLVLDLQWNDTTHVNSTWQGVLNTLGDGMYIGALRRIGGALEGAFGWRDVLMEGFA